MFSKSGQCLRVLSLVSYCKIPKISPVALIFVGAYTRREICVSKLARPYWEGNLRLKIEWASL